MPSVSRSADSPPNRGCTCGCSPDVCPACGYENLGYLVTAGPTCQVCGRPFGRAELLAIDARIRGIADDLSMLAAISGDRALSAATVYALEASCSLLEAAKRAPWCETCRNAEVWLLRTAPGYAAVYCCGCNAPLGEVRM